MLQYACEYFERLFIRYVSEELLAEPYLTGEACAISDRHSVSILPPSDSDDMSSNRFPLSVHWYSATWFLCNPTDGYPLLVRGAHRHDCPLRTQPP